MAPKKGTTNNPHGRPKGVPNKTTKEAREVLERILFAEFDDMGKVLKEIKAEDQAKYVMALEKLLQYVLPKKTDVTTGDEPIKQSLNITVDSKDTAGTLEKLRNGSKSD
jgi:phage terminase small subunit